MKVRSGHKASRGWPIALVVIGALALFLVDSLTIAPVGEQPGRVSAVYPGVKTKSATCREIGVTLAGGKVVLVKVPDRSAAQCQLGMPVVVSHFRTRILGLSSYESLQATSAGL